jgi:hypothetical protein
MKLTLGKVANRQSHVERAETPPSVWGDANARKKQLMNIKKRLNAINNTCMKSYCVTPNSHANVRGKGKQQLKLTLKNLR